METTETLAQSISNLTIPQLVELTKRLKQDWGAIGAPQAIITTAPVQEAAKVAQPEFPVRLLSFPAEKKIAVIKMLREIMGLSLLEAKAVVESVPKPIKEN